MIKKSYIEIAPVIQFLIENGFRKNNRLIAIGGGAKTEDGKIIPIDVDTPLTFILKISFKFMKSRIPSNSHAPSSFKISY